LEDKQLIDKAFSSFSSGRFHEAEIIIRDLIKSNPLVGDYHSKLGLILSKQGKYKSAEKSTRKALDLQPDFEKACLNLLSILESQEEFDEAIMQANDFLKKNPKSIKVLQFLATIYLDLSMVDQAESTIRNAIVIDPSLISPTIELGKILDRKAKLSSNIYSF